MGSRSAPSGKVRELTAFVGDEYDAELMASDSETPAASEDGRGARCPTCRREIPWLGNPARPFCSLACRLIDLGVWLDEGYRIESEDRPPESPPDVR